MHALLQSLLSFEITRNSRFRKFIPPTPSNVKKITEFNGRIAIKLID